MIDPEEVEQHFTRDWFDVLVDGVTILAIIAGLIIIVRVVMSV